MVIVIVGIIVLISGVTLSFPVSFGIDPEDTGIFTDQFSIAESFVPFRTVGESRTTITTETGQQITTTNDFSGAVERLTAQQVGDLLKEFPDTCTMKLFTEIVFEDGSRQPFSTGATPFVPIGTFSLVGDQGQKIKQFEVTPLMTCDTIITASDQRVGYVHQWLNTFAGIEWTFYKEDGSSVNVFTENRNPPNLQQTNPPPRCIPIEFSDVGDLSGAGYTSLQIQRYKETFGGGGESIFIGSERALCAKDSNGVVADPFILLASEVESRLGDIEGKEFDTTMNIRMLGTTILEVPFISGEIGEPFISRWAFDGVVSRQTLSFTVDNLKDSTTEIIKPSPTERTIVIDAFSPTKIDISKLSNSDRTVTLKIKLNNYDTGEGKPKMVVKKNVAILGTLGQATTASISMDSVSFTGVSTIFEGKWTVLKGQSLGNYEVKVSMATRTNDIQRYVEVVQSAKDADSEPTVNGMCENEQQRVEGSDGTEICVAVCADNLFWDLILQACAEPAVCKPPLKAEITDGVLKCVGDPISTGMCSQGLTFNQNTNKCESETKTNVPNCKDNEQLVNIDGGKYACQPKDDFSKFFKVIACVDKIGITDQGICLPPTIAGLFQNPIQLVYIGIGFIIFLVVGKFLWNSVNRTRGGVVLSN